MFEAQLQLWSYYTTIERDGDKIKLEFHQAAQSEFEQEIIFCQVDATVHNEKDLHKESLLKFGPYPDTTKDYIFEEEVTRLPYQFNLKVTKLNEEQQDMLLNLLYDHQKIFSLYDEGLGFCNKLAHAIPTTTDKPVYLPHWSIPHQFQCWDNWKRQGIVRLSKGY